MSWARRGVAAAVATPVSVVGVHALATLQAAWVGPSVAGAAGFLVLPFLLGGLIAWATGSATTVVLGALV
ncbi:MAG: hypothetical protein AAF997_19605, partial [Myxococcota bacterium]